MTKCKICGREFKQLTVSHVKTHGVEYEEYLKKYEFDRYYKKRCAELINELYISVRYKFIKQNSDGSFSTYTRGKNTDKYLINYNIKKHLEGRETYGIFTPNNKSKFIGFDIDAGGINYVSAESEIENRLVKEGRDLEIQNAAEKLGFYKKEDAAKEAEEILSNLLEAERILYKLYSTLRSYNIPKNAVLISFSGCKGFHVDLFLDSMLEADIIENFYEMVLFEVGCRKNEVELRGGKSNLGYKLPLGINFKADRYGYEGFCCPCSSHGEFIKSRKEILKKMESITPIDTKLIEEIVDINYCTLQKAKQKSVFRSVKQKRNQGQNNKGTMLSEREKLEKGLIDRGTRHNSAFKLALFYKKDGLPPEEVEEKLILWHKRLDKSTYKSSEYEAVRDYKEIVKYVFEKDYNLPHEQNSVVLNRKELKPLLKIANKALRRLYFIMLYHSRKHAGDNVFYMTYKQMSSAGAIKNNRSKLKEQIDRLAEMNLIEVVSRDEKIEGSKKHKPNRYKIVENKNISEEKGTCVVLCESKNRCADCFEKVLNELYEPEEIKEYFSYRSAVSIIDNKCEVLLKHNGDSDKQKAA